MRIDLQYGIGTAHFQSCLTFDPVQADWKHHGKKGYEEFSFLKNTGLPPPFQDLFVKRLASHKADGHELMLSCLYQPIRFTPLFLGYASEGNWNYYVYGFLPKIQEISTIFENTRIIQTKMISRPLIGTILYNIWVVLSEVNQRGFIYPDFCYLNIAYIPKRQGILMIDMDSCIKQNAALQPNKYNLTWWELANHANNHAKLKDFQNVNMAMFLSFSLVLCKALAELENGGTTNVAISTLSAQPEDQRKLFQILDGYDTTTFEKIYLTPNIYKAQIPFLFKTWQTILTNLRSGHKIPWEVARGFMLRLLILTGPTAWTHYIQNDTMHCEIFKPPS